MDCPNCDCINPKIKLSKNIEECKTCHCVYNSSCKKHPDILKRGIYKGLAKHLYENTRRL